jgi:hypothetical protein
MSNCVSGGGAKAKWGFDGAVYLVDTGKTRIAGKNVDKRKITVGATHQVTCRGPAEIV